MRWLFVVGASLDLAGALVIAAAVLSRTPAENREEATMRWNANLWLIVMREREQSQVRVGVALLGGGFALQLTGYLWSFRGVSLLCGVVVAAVVLAGGFLGGRRLAARAAPLSYHSDLELPPGIEDERHGYHLANLDEVKTWRTLYTRHLLEKEPQRVHQPILQATVNHGRWLAECPQCRGAAMLSTPGIDTIVCSGTCGVEYPVTFPEDRERIEEVLMFRPIENRNWHVGETVEQLRAENLAHGFPVPE